MRRPGWGVCGLAVFSSIVLIQAARGQEPRTKQIFDRYYSTLRLAYDDVPALIRILEEDSFGVSGWAAQMLGERGEDAREAYPALLRALQGKSRKFSGVKYLLALEAIGAPVDQEARDEAITAVGEAIPDMASWSPAFQAQEAGMRILVGLGPAAVPRLEAIAGHAQDDHARREARKALDRLGKPFREPTPVVPGPPAADPNGPPGPIPRWRMELEPWQWLVCVACLLFCVLSLFFMGKGWLNLRWIRGLTTRDIKTLGAGPAMLRGHASCDRKPILAPLSGRSCVWYRLRVAVPDGEGKEQALIMQDHAEPGWVSDETGRIAVDWGEVHVDKSMPTIRRTGTLALAQTLAPHLQEQIIERFRLRACYEL